MTRYDRQQEFRVGDRVVVRKDCKRFRYSETEYMKVCRLEQKKGKVLSAGKELVMVNFSCDDWICFNYAPEELIKV